MTGGRGHGHHHAAGPRADPRRLLFGLALILAFMAVEVAAGLLARSLALLSDAGHMLTDAGALGLSLIVIRLAARPPAGGLTYGLKRAEVLSGLANGVTLLVIAGAIVVEAIRRLVAPPTVDARWMLGVALAGMLVNLVVTWQLAKAERRSLNVRGSYQHVLTDLYAFAGTAAAAVAILLTGFARADAIASIAVAALMLWAAYGLLRDAVLVLLEAAPHGVRPAELASAMAAHPSVANVHDLHVWEITAGFPALSAHVLVRPGDDCHAVRRDLEQLLEQRFGIDHTTLQVDHLSRQGPITIGPAADDVARRAEPG
ncbi:MAG TPA: cation diffusion facilitator family transporter [Candidatus Dormibacteraeota bacterium]|nr:cation diffusion facilitator family transporter [Candidatus Dormibacteraeota bacterium]